MIKDWKYIAYLVTLVLIVVVTLLSKKSQHNWTLTYAHDDVNPYGTFVFTTLLNKYQATPSPNSYKTFYELRDSLHASDNLLIISSSFNPDKADTKVILEKIYAGSNMLLAADHYHGIFADTFGIETGDSFFQGDGAFNSKDSLSVRFVNNAIDTATRFVFSASNTSKYFHKADSSKLKVVARNEFNQPIVLRLEHGRGQIILCSTPIVFANIYLVAGNNHQFVSTLLNHLPSGTIYRSEFYHLGRREINTPLRFILQTEPLRWAYFITIFALIIFMIFESKRKQRAIPIVKPLQNTTLEFATTIGNLYFQKGDHKNIAEKRIQFFLDQLHSRYFLPPNFRQENFASALASKTGVDEQTSQELVKLIHHIHNSLVINKEELLKLNRLLEIFQNNK